MNQYILQSCPRPDPPLGALQIGEQEPAPEIGHDRLGVAWIDGFLRQSQYFQRLRPRFLGCEGPVGAGGETNAAWRRHTIEKSTFDTEA